MRFWPAVAVVFRKELADALRDRRTLTVVLVSAVLMGPLLLLALSSFIATLEAKAERRELLMVGRAHAPTLVNYVQRQTWRVVDAPADYEQRLRDSKLGDPVLMVPSDFESALSQGDIPELLLISDSGNKQSQSAVRPVAELVRGFSQERIALGLALRGVGGELLQPLKLQEFDLASQQGRAAQFTGMLALFVLMAVVSGALNAALDTTAGERERGSLEPLLMNPASTLALVAGKWAAVASVGMTIAVLSCLSFLPGQWLLQSDSLQAMFQFGLGEVAGFLLILLPFACAISALLMAVAIRSKSLKEAQANTTVVLMAVSLAPMVSVLNQTGDEPWHMWVPALAQNILMMRVLKGEHFSVLQAVAPPLVCLVLTLAALAYVARNLRRLALR